MTRMIAGMDGGNLLGHLFCAILPGELRRPLAWTPAAALLALLGWMWWPNEQKMLSLDGRGVDLDEIYVNGVRRWRDAASTTAPSSQMAIMCDIRNGDRVQIGGGDQSWEFIYDCWNSNGVTAVIGDRRTVEVVYWK